MRLGCIDISFQDICLKNDSGYEDLKEKLREIMWTKMGVVMNREKLETASKKYELYEKKIKNRDQMIPRN